MARYCYKQEFSNQRWEAISGTIEAIQELFWATYGGSEQFLYGFYNIAINNAAASQLLTIN